MGTNKGHPLFRTHEQKAEARGDRADTRGEPEYGNDTYIVTYRTRPGGPVTTMRIEAQSSWSAKQIALSRGVRDIESVRATE